MDACDTLHFVIFWMYCFSFWSDVPTELVQELEKPWAYKHDFELFGYNTQHYFTTIGLQR